MAIVLDHTIVSVKDQKEAVSFYVQILGFKDEGRFGHFAIVRVNESLTFDFVLSEKFPTRHFAFGMDPRARPAPRPQRPGRRRNARRPAALYGQRGL